MKPSVDWFSKSYLIAETFTGRAYHALESLTLEEYRMRTGDLAKPLIEEILPLAALVRKLDVPGRRARCKYYPGSGQFDAKLRLSGDHVDHGFARPEYYVEVTTAVSNKDYLRRESLHRYGSVFGGDSIYRKGSRSKGNDEIVSEAQVQDGEEPARQARFLVEECLRLKAAKGYPTPCILLINVIPEKRLSIEDWCHLTKAVVGAGGRDTFDLVFLSDFWNNSVFDA
jgi:hypothetical protein